jgi:hypothetical protein
MIPAIASTLTAIISAAVMAALMIRAFEIIFGARK